MLQLAHDIPSVCKLGLNKTLAQVHREVWEYCASCPKCQWAALASVLWIPLVPLSLVGTPFERVAVDLVGPLEWKVLGYRYLLILVDYSTCFPEAIPLKNTTAQTVMGELVKVFTRLGLTRELFTHQGTNFTSRLL